MEELNNETMNEEAYIIEDDAELEEGSGMGGKIALGVAALGAVGAGVAAFAAKKSGKLDEIREAHRQKRIERLEAKLEKEYIQVPLKNKVITIEKTKENEE